MSTLTHRFGRRLQQVKPRKREELKPDQAGIAVDKVHFCGQLRQR